MVGGRLELLPTLGKIKGGKGGPLELLALESTQDHIRGLGELDKGGKGGPLELPASESTQDHIKWWAELDVGTGK